MEGVSDKGGGACAGGLQQGTTDTSCEDRAVTSKNRSKTKFDILKTYVCCSTDHEHTYVSVLLQFLLGTSRSSQLVAVVRAQAPLSVLLT